MALGVPIELIREILMDEALRVLMEMCGFVLGVMVLLCIGGYVEERWGFWSWRGKRK